MAAWLIWTLLQDFRRKFPWWRAIPSALRRASIIRIRLIRPDKRGFEPRVGIAWRPLPASSLVIRAGYGVYYDTSVYQTIATQMAQQYPLSKSLSVQNTP
jgi:hypothetical protein